MKRFVIVLSTLELGGAERQAIYFARWLKQKNYNVHMLSLSSRIGAAADLCDQYGLSYSVANFYWPTRPVVSHVLLPWRLFKLMLKIRKFHPDVILSYCMESDLACSLLWKLTGAKACIWEQRDEGRNRKQKIYESMAVKLPSHFISNSRHGAEFLVKELKISQDQVTVVKNGAEIKEAEQTPEEWRRKLNVNSDTLLFCMTANLHNHKDHETLLKAWRIFIKNYQGNAKLLLAGRKEQTYEKLQKLSCDLNIEDSIEFMGMVSDISGLLKTVNIFVFCSNYEGVPNSVIEAMANSLPVIATDIPGIREAVGDNYSYLAPPMDDQTFAGFMLDFANNKDKRYNIGAVNKAYALKNFTVDRMCQNTFSVIQHAVPDETLETKEKPRG